MWLEVIKTLLGAAQHRQEQEQRQRERISRLYLEIAQLLLDTADELQGDQYPAGRCQTMWALSQMLVQELKGRLPDDRLLELEQMLHACSQLEREFASRKDPSTVRAMVETAGQFKALAMLQQV